MMRPRSGASREPGRWVGIGLASAAIAVGAAGCGVFESMRRHTYPPSFNYISDEQLDSAMWQLAAGIQRLEDVFVRGGPLSQGQRVSVIETLKGMEAAAARLGPEGWPSNHGKITQNLGGFRDDLAAARRAVANEPPSYRLARELSAACMSCHLEP